MLEISVCRMGMVQSWHRESWWKACSTPLTGAFLGLSEALLRVFPRVLQIRLRSDHQRAEIILAAKAHALVIALDRGQVHRWHRQLPSQHRWSAYLRSLIVVHLAASLSRTLAGMLSRYLSLGTRSDFLSTMSLTATYDFRACGYSISFPVNPVTFYENTLEVNTSYRRTEDTAYAMASRLLFCTVQKLKYGEVPPIMCRILGSRWSFLQHINEPWILQKSPEILHYQNPCRIAICGYISRNVLELYWNVPYCNRFSKWDTIKTRNVTSFTGSVRE